MRFQVNRATLVDPQILELERRRIFDVCWIYVGHESEVRAPGRLQDPHRLRPAGHLLPRQQEPGPRLPQYLPPPRQHRLPRGRRQREELHLLLPRLELQPRRRARRACPGEDAYPPRFRKSDFGLKEPPHVASYRGFVFLNFDANAVPLEEYLAGREGIHRHHRGPVALRRDGGDPGPAGLRHPRQLEAAGGEQLRRLPPDQRARLVARLPQELRGRDEAPRERPPAARPRRGQGARQRPRLHRQRELPRPAGRALDPDLRRGGEAGDRAHPRRAGGAPGRSSAPRASPTPTATSTSFRTCS